MSDDTPRSVQDLRIKALEVSLEVEKKRLDDTRKMAADHEEQINGKRGLYSAIEDLSAEIKSLRRSIAAVGTGIIIAAISFGLEVLK